MTAGSPVAPTRIAALDLARFVALAGMFAAHTWNRNEDGTATLIGDLVAGRAAALFAVLAGIGVVLVTRGVLARADRGAAVRLLIARGVVILLIGLMLGFLATNVYIVIAYYGLLFCVMAPLVLLRTRWLLAILVALALAGPLVNQAIRGELGVEFELGSPDLLDAGDPVVLVRALLLTGIYPVITWLVYGLVGVVIGRALLTAVTSAARRMQGLRLVVGGVAASLVGAVVSGITLDVAGGRDALVAGWAGGTERLVELFLDRSGEGGPVPGDPLWLFAATPHTGTTPDLLITSGIACAVIGLLLVVIPDPGPRTRLALLPFLGAGAAPLTIYSVHVVSTTAVPEVAELLFGRSVPFALESSAGLWIFNLALALLLGGALRLLDVRGPLETLVTAAGRRAARPRTSVAKAG
jgi:hypothetical protein